MTSNNTPESESHPDHSHKKVIVILGILIAILVIVGIVLAIVTVIRTDDSGEDFGLNDDEITLSQRHTDSPSSVDISAGEPIQGKNHKKIGPRQPPYNPHAPQSQWPSTLFRKNVMATFQQYLFLTRSMNGYQLYKTDNTKWYRDLSRVATPDLVQRAMEFMEGVDRTPDYMKKRSFFGIREQRTRLCGYYDCVIDVLPDDRPRSAVGVHEQWFSYGIKQFNNDPRQWKVVKEVVTQWIRKG